MAAIRAHEMRVKLAGEAPVGRILSGAGDETEILDPVMRMSVRIHDAVLREVRASELVTIEGIPPLVLA